MSHFLEQLYAREIKLDEQEKKQYKALLQNVLSVVIEKMKEASPAFKELYRRNYYGGSFYDGLKVGSTGQEFDLNILFSWPDHSIKIANLGDDVRKPNFADLQNDNYRANQNQKQILGENRYGKEILSPKKMFTLLKTTVDKALTKIGNTVTFEANEYKVRRSVKAPVMLSVEGNGMKFSVDFVPSVEMDMEKLNDCKELKNHVQEIKKDFYIEANTFMAIALHKASGDMFEIDFHDLERGILHDRGCAKKIIRLIKYLRDSKGGTVLQLWSHLLKVFNSFNDKIIIFIKFDFRHL